MTASKQTKMIKSRNAREGKYQGCQCGKHMRGAMAFAYAFKANRKERKKQLRWIKEIGPMM